MFLDDGTRTAVDVRSEPQSESRDDITRAFERYKKLSEPTARNIVAFYERRLKLRANADSKNKRGQNAASVSAIDDDIVVVPSPPLAPM